MLTNNMTDFKVGINSSVDNIEDRITTTEEKISIKIQENKDELLSEININKEKIIVHESAIKKIKPRIDFIDKTYIPIIINLLLSKPVLLLNRFLKIYELCIVRDGLDYIIDIEPCTNKSYFSDSRKRFKNSINDLRKFYDITYDDLVDNTLKYLKNTYTVGDEL